MKEIPQATLDRLIKQASQKIASENPEFNAMDFSGGNFDDAFSMGIDDGIGFCARHILDDLGIPYIIES